MRYDALGNTVAVSDANGHVTENIYNELSQRVTTITPKGGEIHFEYDTI